MTANTELFLLGQAHMLDAAGSRVVLERHDAALLASLVVHGPLARDKAAALIWPDTPRAAAQTSLRQRLFRLNRRAGRAWVSSTAVLTLAADVRHDLGAFTAETNAGPPAADELLATLAYAGTGELSRWVDGLRSTWAQRRQPLLADAAQAHESAGRPALALACALRVLRHDPLDEAAHRQCMRLHYAAGQNAAARVAWLQCVQALHQHAGATPSAATRELAEWIEHSGMLPGPDAARAADTNSTSPGATHRAVALRRPPRLVGRADTWQSLEIAWSLHRNVVLLGEPGMGKSRLLGDFAQAQAGMPVVQARPGFAATPYTLLELLLRTVLEHTAACSDPVLADGVRAELARLLPALGLPAPGALMPLHLQRAVALALADWHAQGLQAVLVDDWQFADTASQDLLLTCFSQAPHNLPRLLLAVRAHEAPASLVAWQGAQAAHSLAVLALTPWLLEDVEELLMSLQLPALRPAEWAPMLARRTGGNPLFVLLVLAASAGITQAAQVDIPADVLRLLAQRLQRLTPQALQLLRVAALAGQDFSVELAARVLTLHALALADSLTELEAAHLFADDECAYDLVAEAALNGLPAALAVSLHAAVADALEQQSARPAVVGRHRSQAQQWPAAARCFMAAAQDVPASAAQHTKLAYLDLAADAALLARDADTAWQARLAALVLAQTLEDAGELAARAEQLLARAQGPIQQLQALLHRCRIGLAASNARDVLLPSARALALAGQVGNAAQQLAAAGWRGLALSLTGQPDAGLALLLENAPAAQAEVDLRARVDFFGSLGYALHVAGRAGEAVPALREAAQGAQALGDWGDCMEQFNNLAVCHNTIGERQAEVQAVERALHAWQALGEPAGLAADSVLVQACTTLAAEGRYAECLRLLPGAAQRLAASQAPDWAVIAGDRLALLYVRLGQPVRARQALPPLHAGAAPGAQAARALTSARLQALAGEDAEPLLRQAWQRWGAALQPLDRQNLILSLAQATADDAECITLCNGLLAQAPPDPGASTPMACRAWLVRATRLLLLNDKAPALHDLRRLWPGPDVPRVLGLDTAQICFEVQVLARKLNDPSIASQALKQGLAWVQRVRQEVPAEFQHSFLNRNPAVRGLMMRGSAQPQGAVVLD